MTAIDAHDLRKRYKTRAGMITAVDGISLTVDDGTIHGLLGPNGAGKTTTVELIAGLRKPDGGTVAVCGLDPQRERAKVRQVLGVQLQSGALHFSLTVREMAHLYRTFYSGGRDPDELIEAVGLGDSAAVRFENLSGGQQQRLAIVLALLGNPRVVILDELTTGLDPQARRQIWELVEQIRASGVTVLLVSHLMEEVERLCDVVTLIDGGTVVAQDSPAGLIAAAGLDERVRFRAAVLPDGLLDDLPGVSEVSRDGDQVSVTGTGDLLQHVSTALVRAGVVATETRADRATLDDAFVALTGRTSAPGHSDAATASDPASLISKEHI